MNSELEEYKGISSKYSKLQDEYSSIKSSYESLMKDYEELKKMYEVLRSISWLSEDERIMITCELIEEYPFTS